MPSGRRALTSSARSGVCAPGSHSSADVVTLLEHAHPDEIERSLYEADHVARAFESSEASFEPSNGIGRLSMHRRPARSPIPIPSP